VIDDHVHYGIVGEEGDDLHHRTALRTQQRVNFINFADHLSPASAGNSLEFLLDKEELMFSLLRLWDFALVGIGIEAEVANVTLPFSGICEVTRAINSR